VKALALAAFLTLLCACTERVMARSYEAAQAVCAGEQGGLEWMEQRTNAADIIWIDAHCKSGAHRSLALRAQE
jgi:hypothetical protein